MIEPQGYWGFIYLVQYAKIKVTDSMGVTEKATVLGIPCLMLRKSTERPETVTIGTKELIGDDYNKLSKYLKQFILDDWKKGKFPLYGMVRPQKE